MTEEPIGTTNEISFKRKYRWDFSGIEFKRKFRWTAEITSQDGKKTYLKEAFVKVERRPYPDENSEKKCSESNDFEYHCVYENRQSAAFTILDAKVESCDSLYKWIGEVYDFNSGLKLSENNHAKVVLRLYDGCGVLVESFVMHDGFPSSINFGELSYSSSDDLEIELTFSYSEVEFRDEMGIARAKNQ